MRAIATLTRLGHTEAYRYSWNYFVECINELAGKPTKMEIEEQDEWLKKMGVMK